MVITLGPLSIIWGKVVEEKPHFIVVEKRIKVKKPVPVEIVKEYPNYILKPQDEVIDMPRFPVNEVVHQRTIHRWRVKEVDKQIVLDNPVRKDVDVPYTVEHLRPKHVDVPFPKRKLSYYAEEVAVKVDADNIIDVLCTCGRQYKSNMSKCTRCGKTTVDNLKES